MVDRYEQIAEARMLELENEPLRRVGAPTGLFKGTVQSVKDVLGYRELLGLLVRRELKAKYKDSALGFLWTLIRPLVMLLVYFIVMGHFLQAARQIADFGIYIFCGLVIWNLFLECVAGGTGSILGNSGLVKKVYLPREVFPLSVVGSALFNFATQMIILLVACLWIGKFPMGERWLFFPLAVAVALVWGTALGIFFGAVNVYLRDVQYLVEVTLTVWFWTCPVVYAWHFVDKATVAHEWARELYLANPVATAILGMQRTFWVGAEELAPGLPAAPDGVGTRLVVMLVIGLVLLWLAQRVFAKLQANFAQEM